MDDCKRPEITSNARNIMENMMEKSDYTDRLSRREHEFSTKITNESFGQHWKSTSDMNLRRSFMSKLRGKKKDMSIALSTRD